MRRLSRLLACFVLGLALFQAVGSRLAGFVVACVESCSDDQAGDCPGVCGCACHAPQRIPLAAPVALPEPAANTEPVVVVVATAPASPDPRALLHPPIALLG